MGKKKKDPAKKATALAAYKARTAQTSGDRSARTDQHALHETWAVAAAQFLCNEEQCAPEQVKTRAALQLSVISNIARGRFSATPEQATDVYTTATAMGWKIPTHD